MSKQSPLTRAQRRSRRGEPAAEGVYGVDTEDAGASSWTGRYLMWARSPQHAAERIRDAGFHRRRTEASWDPTRLPPQALPDQLHAETAAWFRSRLDDDGWTPWQTLPADYRHPPQGLAAVDPSLR
ncbi:hypothetical protein WDV85_12140 [Pseudokineococcus sp. 5B2Z-1]|uniref:hypothetical protein n=1 Tax=Pseudokineococcus sp. 5B2Z-1 TaxID=3132744 RepID=UPI0030B2A89F